MALAGGGNLAEALTHFQKALEIKPEYAEAHLNLGMALVNGGRTGEAIAHYQKALEIKPEYAEAHFNLGNVYFAQARPEAAMAEYLAALRIKPDYSDARCNLGLVQYQRGVVSEAIAEWREVLGRQPDHAPALNRLAWVLATSPVRSLRNGTEAVELAGRAAKLTGGRDAGILDALAAAYAEAGRFAEAVETAQAALTLAKNQNNPAHVEGLQSRIKLYEAGSPYRDTHNP